jgi:hypothetical protein
MPPRPRSIDIYQLRVRPDNFAAVDAGARSGPKSRLFDEGQDNGVNTILDSTRARA